MRPSSEYTDLGTTYSGTSAVNPDSLPPASYKVVAWDPTTMGSFLYFGGVADRDGFLALSVLTGDWQVYDGSTDQSALVNTSPISLATRNDGHGYGGMIQVTAGQRYYISVVMPAGATGYVAVVASDYLDIPTSELLDPGTYQKKSFTVWNGYGGGAPDFVNSSQDGYMTEAAAEADLATDMESKLNELGADRWPGAIKNNSYSGYGRVEVGGSVGSYIDFSVGLFAFRWAWSDYKLGQSPFFAWDYTAELYAPGGSAPQRVSRTFAPTQNLVPPANAYSWEWEDGTSDPVEGTIVGSKSTPGQLYDVVSTVGDWSLRLVTEGFSIDSPSVSGTGGFTWDYDSGAEIMSFSDGDVWDMELDTGANERFILLAIPSGAVSSGEVFDIQASGGGVVWTLQPPMFRWLYTPDPVWDIVEVPTPDISGAPGGSRRRFTPKRSA